MNNLNNIYVIGDVHGCIFTLKQLIAKLPKNAELIFVGDLIDKGNFSKEVVEFVMAGGFQCILGNHESLMLEHIDGVLLGEKTPNWSTKSYFGGYKTIADYKDDSTTLKRHMKWMRTIPRYIEIDKFFITHAFALPYYNRRDLPEVHIGLMSNRPSDVDEWGWDLEEGYENYDVVNIFGHAVVDKVDLSSNNVGIDTGCVYGKSLTALALGTMSVYTQAVDVRDIEIKA
jgi:serine/threonine protein phosphatase 1